VAHFRTQRAFGAPFGSSPLGEPIPILPRSLPSEYYSPYSYRAALMCDGKFRRFGGTMSLNSNTISKQKLQAVYLMFYKPINSKKSK